MKKLFLFLLLTILSISAFAQYVVEDEGNIKIKGLNRTLIVGDLVQLYVDNTYDGMTVWTSDNESVATISEDGWLSAVGNGSCKIKASALSNPNIYDEINIIVNDFNLNGGDFNDVTYVMSVGDTKKIYYDENISYVYGGITFTYKYYSMKVYDYTNQTYSQPVNIANVNHNSTTNCVTITAKQKGVVCLYFRYYRNSTTNQRTKRYLITISNQQATPQSVYIKNCPDYISTSVKDCKVTATVYPSDANQSVTWSSDDSSIISVNYQGILTPKKVGKTKIRAKACNGISNYWDIEVYDQNNINITKINVSPSSVTLNVGETKALSKSISPIYASSQSVNWNSDNTKIATVDSNGKVTAKGAGTIKIKCESAKDTSVYGYCTVTVNNPIISVENITLEPQSAIIEKGSSLTLNATVLPDNATDKSVTWSSSDENVATVADGVVLGVKAGTSTITVTTTDGNKTASCEVTVTEPKVNVESVKLDKTSATINKGETLTLNATVEPENATDNSVTWSSSDENVATVADGVVTAIAGGTATITVTTNDGGYTATCEITVIAPYVPVESVTLNKTSATLIVGDTTTLIATVNPNNATDKTVKWKSYNTNVATIDANGVVTAKSKGTADIVCYTNDKDKNGKQLNAKCRITVNDNLIESVSIDKTSVTLPIGETTTLTATVKPDNASNRTVMWKSYNTKVATVDANGVVTAKSKGTADIVCFTNAKTKSGVKLNGKCRVKVIDISLVSLTLDKSSATLNLGEKLTLTATVLPENASNKSVTWKSYNTNVATIDSKGVITAKGIGSADIICFTKAKDASGKQLNVKCKIKVVNVPLTSISLNTTKVTLSVGDTTTLTSTVLPENASNKTVKWKSYNTNVATVDANGVITAVGKGSADIYCFTNGKNKDGKQLNIKCKVTVK